MTQEPKDKQPEEVEQASISAELLYGEGAVELFQQDGKFFLSQGEIAVDVTDILESVNYQLGRIVLKVRLSGHKGTQVSNQSREWLHRQLQAPGPEITKKQEAGFTPVLTGGK